MSAGGALHFTLADPAHTLRQVRLYQELGRPYDGPPLIYDRRRREWHVDIPDRGAARVEYLFNVQCRDAAWSSLPDPNNPLRAPGPFGEKSVIELPGYRPPAWLDAEIEVGAPEPMLVPSRRLGRDVPVLLWTTPGHDASDRLPLLVALDGPELAAYSALLVLLAQGPPLHVALVAPIHRDDEYSASAVFAGALASEVIPAIASRRSCANSPLGRAGLGVSLGAVALLHAHRRHPDLFGGLFLQSGSFFQRSTDAHEAGFGRFAKVSRFVQGVLRSERPTSGLIRVVLTCGAVEENLANNRAMHDALVRQGYDASMSEHPDGHNWVSWRDALDPRLPDLLMGLRA